MVMQMTVQNVLVQAQQGDPDAIATLINQVISKKGLTVTAKSKGNCLHVVITGDLLPDRDSCIRFIHDGMMRLHAKPIESVRLYGKRSDQKWPSWTELLELRQPVQTVASPTLPQIAKPAVEQKRKQVKLKTRYRKKVPLLLLGGLCWVLVAAIGFFVRAKIDSQTENNSQLLAPVKVAPETVNKAASTPNNKQRTGVPTPPKKLTPPSPATQKTALQAIQTPTNSASPKSPFPSPISEKSNPNSSTKTQTNTKAVETSPSIFPKEPFTNTEESYISIKAVGDIVPGTNFPNNRLPSNNKQLFQNIKPYLQGSDILFGNFESTLTNYPRTGKDTSRPMVHAFRTPPSYANLLKETGFDVLSVANNHSFDFTAVGFQDTLKNIEKAGMTPVGEKNKIAYKTVKNVRMAFIGFSHLDGHNSVNNLAAAKKLVVEAKKNADIVVISVHAGAEGTGAMHVKNKQEIFYGENRGNKVLFARTLIDSGADLVLGHGPHVPRAMELYKGKLIAYSLGNFVGYRTLSTWGVLGQSLILEVKLNQKGDFVEGKVIPVQLDRRGIPSIDRNFRSAQLIRNLMKSDFPNTDLKLDPKGQISKRSN